MICLAGKSRPLFWERTDKSRRLSETSAGLAGSGGGQGDGKELKSSLLPSGCHFGTYCLMGSVLRKSRREQKNKGDARRASTLTCGGRGGGEARPKTAIKLVAKWVLCSNLDFGETGARRGQSGRPSGGSSGAGSGEGGGGGGGDGRRVVSAAAAAAVVAALEAARR